MEIIPNRSTKTTATVWIITIVVGLLLLVILTIKVAKAVADWANSTTVIVRNIPFDLSISDESKSFSYNGFFDFEPRVVLKTKVAEVRVTDDVLLSNEQPIDTWKNIMDMVKASPNQEYAMLIVTVFGDEAEWFLPTAIAESGLDATAMNWNCMYGGESTFCAYEDRDLAWSVDCGLAQLNFSGTECPAQAFDPVWNILSAKSKFERQGRGAWVAAHKLGLVN